MSRRRSFSLTRVLSTPRSYETFSAPFPTLLLRLLLHHLLLVGAHQGDLGQLLQHLLVRLKPLPATITASFSWCREVTIGVFFPVHLANHYIVGQLEPIVLAPLGLLHGRGAGEAQACVAQVAGSQLLHVVRVRHRHGRGGRRTQFVHDFQIFRHCVLTLKESCKCRRAPPPYRHHAHWS